jgi:flotillin
MFGYLIPALIALLFIVLLASGYTKAPPDMAYIISGVRKKPRILIGQAGVKVPFFERLDKLSLGAIQIDVKTKSAVPTAEYINIRVDSTVSVRVGRTEEMIALAAQNFLNVNRETIASKINDLLEGNIREIVGQMKLTEMVSDRKAFSEKVQANVVPDLARFGLELVSFNVQNFNDDNGVIENLGIDNTEQIRKDAAIAKSNAQREIAVAEAENEKAANDARVNAATEVARRQTEFAIEKAEMQKRVETEQAKADAAKKIEAENQRKSHEIASANADLAKLEKETELKEREVAVKERVLEAEIKKTAEAQKYAEQQKADAKLYATQKAAEAELFERERKADAARIEAEKKAAADLALATAEAEAQKKLAEAIEAEGRARAAAAQAQGEAEAAAIKAKAEAEAEGLMKKAEAMKQYGEAAMADMQMEVVKHYFSQLPAVAEAIGKGYQGVDKIVMLGNDSGQLAGNIMSTTTQISEGMEQALGIDLKSLLSGVLGAKLVAPTDNQ